MQIFGRNLFWYAAVFGTITAISRAAVTDELLVLDPEGAMSLVVQHSHYMPKRWRGKENTEIVRMEFETLFQVIVNAGNLMVYLCFLLWLSISLGFPMLDKLCILAVYSNDVAGGDGIYFTNSCFAHICCSEGYFLFIFYSTYSWFWMINSLFYCMSSLQQVNEVLQFISEFTVYVDGVGDVCRFLLKQLMFCLTF